MEEKIIPTAQIKFLENSVLLKIECFNYKAMYEKLIRLLQGYVC